MAKIANILAKTPPKHNIKCYESISAEQTAYACADHLKSQYSQWSLITPIPCRYE